jgi:hypothetical protein
VDDDVRSQRQRLLEIGRSEGAVHRGIMLQPEVKPCKTS